MKDLTMLIGIIYETDIQIFIYSIVTIPYHFSYVFCAVDNFLKLSIAEIVFVYMYSLFYYMYIGSNDKNNYLSFAALGSI